MEGREVGEGREPAVEEMLWLGDLLAGDGERSLRLSGWVTIGGGLGASIEETSSRALGSAP